MFYKQNRNDENHRKRSGLYGKRYTVRAGEFLRALGTDVMSLLKSCWREKRMAGKPQH